MVEIVAFSGPDGTGKSSLARVYETQLPESVPILSFANPIYEEVADYLGITEAELREPTVKNKNRPLLRAVGEQRRLEDPLYWVRAMQAIIQREGYTRVIIDDLRFVTEAQMVKDSGGTLVYLDRQILPEEMKNSTFQDLPQVADMADILVKAQYASPETMVSNLLDTPLDCWLSL